MTDLIRDLIIRWRDNPAGTSQSWFLWDDRLKNFRSIRRGLQQVVAEIAAGTLGVAYCGFLIPACAAILKSMCLPPFMRLILDKVGAVPESPNRWVSL